MGDTAGYFDSDNELTVDQMGNAWMLRRMMMMTASEWENVARFC